MSRRLIDALRDMACSNCSAPGPCGIYLILAGGVIALCQRCHRLGKAEAAQDQGKQLADSNGSIHGPHDSAPIATVPNHF